MGSDLKISDKIQDYILNNGLNLHPVQKEIIEYNKSLGDLKRMQIAISQSQFLHLIVKITKIKKILEIGTFTGLSTLSMALALPEDGKILALDKNIETTKHAINFFEKGKTKSQNNYYGKSCFTKFTRN
jgi:caffeoyl-CoA O-methyltransferase